MTRLLLEKCFMIKGGGKICCHRKTGNIIVGGDNKWSKKVRQCESSGDLFQVTGKRLGHWVRHHKVCVEEFSIKMYKPYSSDYSYSSDNFTDSDSSDYLITSFNYQLTSTCISLLQMVDSE